MPPQRAEMAASPVHTPGVSPAEFFGPDTHESQDLDATAAVPVAGGSGKTFPVPSPDVPPELVRGHRPGDLVDQVGNTSESEHYSPMPAGYQRGRHKYVVVLGTVMSGLGKGIFSSSLAKMFKDKGLKVAPIKMEGYLNMDSGTLNPYRHGEVFVLEDGTECDMDLGTYERLLDQSLSKHNFLTSGQVFSEILKRERQGAYLGRDVQWIPHVTGEIKRKLRELAIRGDGNGPADVIFVEVGGTVGDYENGMYIEALRELAFEEGQQNVCFVALTYVIEPPALGEQKSKAAQLGIKRLMEAGVQPQVIACRASNPVGEKIREKIAMFSNVPLRRVFSMHDRASIYTIPEDMRAEGLDREILSLLGLHDRADFSSEDRARERWMGFVRRLTAKKTREVTIGVAGKYANLRDAYASIDKALEHCAANLGTRIDLHWIDTTEVNEENVGPALMELDAVIVPGGFGNRGVEGKIASVRYCRENAVPYLGICLGFQVAVIEFARNVLGLPDANSTEFDPNTRNPVISELPEQKRIEGLGGTMRLGAQDVVITPGSLAHFLYDGQRAAHERFRHRYEVDPAFIDRLTAAGMVFSGKHPTRPIMQILELPQTLAPSGPGVRAHAGAATTIADKPGVTHPFFIGGQFHPELTGRPLRPQPMFMGLVAAAIRRKYQDSIDRADPWAEDLRRWTRSAARAERVRV